MSNVGQSVNPLFVIFAQLRCLFSVAYTLPNLGFVQLIIFILGLQSAIFVLLDFVTGIKKNKQLRIEKLHFSTHLKKLDVKFFLVH